MWASEASEDSGDACSAASEPSPHASCTKKRESGDGRGACASDYAKFCAGTSPGGGRVVACLTKQQNQLSDSCKKVLASRKTK